MNNTDMLQSAAAAYQAGNPFLTEQIARGQLRAGGEFETWMVMLALSLQSQGRRDEAVDAYAELTRHYPKSSIHWGNLGTALREAKRFEESESAYCQAIVLDRANALNYVNVGLLLAETGNYPSARNAFLQALDIDQALVQARIHGALACYQCGDHRTARSLLSERDDWRHATDLQVEDYLTLSNALLQLGQSTDAEQVLVAAMAQARPHEKPVLQAHLVSVYERLNRLDDAQRIADALPDPATVGDPKLAQEIANVRAGLAHRNNDLVGAKELLTELSGQSEPATQGEASLMFSLAKVCDKQNDPAEAMRALEQAHAAQSRSLAASSQLSDDPESDPLRGLSSALDAGQFARWPADWRDPLDARPDPIFIVGFPRSGTTLLEQMLDATPGLRSMDERDFMQDRVNALTDAGSIYPEALGGLDATQLRGMRAAYWANVAGIVKLEPGERLVDKNPLNMLLLPMIRRLFPASRIILALRHPCDVVLSCYMQQFRSPVFVNMCANLPRLARSYVNAMRFWIEHEHLLQPQVLHLRYEDMLADFDGHARELGDFLGIGNVEAMHDFHGHARRKGYIATPSYDQVIQPLNSAAVGRWRKYEPYFQNVLPILQPIIEHWGYAG